MHRSSVSIVQGSFDDVLRTCLAALGECHHAYTHATAAAEPASLQRTGTSSLSFKRAKHRLQAAPTYVDDNITWVYASLHSPHFGVLPPPPEQPRGLHPEVAQLQESEQLTSAKPKCSFARRGASPLQQNISAALQRRSRAAESCHCTDLMLRIQICNHQHAQGMLMLRQQLIERPGSPNTTICKACYPILLGYKGTVDADAAVKACTVT